MMSQFIIKVSHFVIISAFCITTLWPYHTFLEHITLMYATYFIRTNCRADKKSRGLKVAQNVGENREFLCA